MKTYEKFVSILMVYVEANFKTISYVLQNRQLFLSVNGGK